MNEDTPTPPVPISATADEADGDEPVSLAELRRRATELAARIEAHREELRKR